MVTKYEWFEPTPDGDLDYGYPYDAVAQTFTIGTVGTNENITTTKVTLKLYQDGFTGTLSVTLCATDGSGHPTGSALASTTMAVGDITTNSAGADYDFTLTASLSASTKYAIVVRYDGGLGDHVYLKSDVSSPTYTGGNVETLIEPDWTADETIDVYFQVWGNPVAVVRGMMFGTQG